MKRVCPMDTDDKCATLHTLQAAVEHCESTLPDPPEPRVCQSSAGTDAGWGHAGSKWEQGGTWGSWGQQSNHPGHTTMSSQAVSHRTFRHWLSSPPETKWLCPTRDRRQCCGQGTNEGIRTAPAQTAHSLCGLGKAIFPASASIYPSIQWWERASQVCRDLLVISFYCKLLRKVLWMQLALMLGGCQETRFSSRSWLWRGSATEDSSPTALHQSVLSSVSTSLQLQWGNSTETGEAAPRVGTVPAQALTSPPLQKKPPVIEVFRPGPHTGREKLRV